MHICDYLHLVACEIHVPIKFYALINDSLSSSVVSVIPSRGRNYQNLENVIQLVAPRGRTRESDKVA